MSSSCRLARARDWNLLSAWGPRLPPRKKNRRVGPRCLETILDMTEGTTEEGEWGLKGE